MNQIPKLTIILSTGILLWIAACTTDHYKSNLFSDAIHVVDTNPQETLKLLKGISREYLRVYDKDQYMQFVVILTQARYMDYQDITGDFH